MITFVKKFVARYNVETFREIEKSKVLLDLTVPEFAYSLKCCY